MTAAAYFAHDYEEAVAKFRAAAAKAKARRVVHRNPYATGPGGRVLETDVAILGPDDAPNTVLITSATHGVEGFAGSGAEVAMLETGLLAKAGRNTKIVIVHALNPYGFAWLRRVNEDNVDLNRNSVDHGAPYPRNAGYEELHEAIAPNVWGDGVIAPHNARLKDYAIKNGAFALQGAISAGQYSHPDGLYFGGHKEAWSIGLLRHIVRRELAHAKRTIFLDFHTGLGAFGDVELISEYAAEDPAYTRAKSWWGEQVKTTATGESLSAHLTGTLDTLVPSLLPHAEVTAIALEYGTYPVDAVFRALRADNWLHLHANPEGPEAPAIKAEIRQAFYPDTAEWKARVWEQAEVVVAKSLAVLG